MQQSNIHCVLCTSEPIITPLKKGMLCCFSSYYMLFERTVRRWCLSLSLPIFNINSIHKIIENSLKIIYQPGDFPPLPPLGLSQTVQLSTP